MSQVSTLVTADAKTFLASDDIGNNELDHVKTEGDYKSYIYDHLSISAKQAISRILGILDEINQMVAVPHKDYDQARHNAMNTIYNKANEAEAQIKNCWDSTQLNKDFYFYIGLHYASHLLGMSIKAEQVKIRNAFVGYKKKREQEVRKVSQLKRRQINAYSKHKKAEISREINACCKEHKQLSMLAGQLGDINANYHERVTQQNIQTAKRRDYIAASFGEQGQRWLSNLFLADFSPNETHTNETYTQE